MLLLALLLKLNYPPFLLDHLRHLKCSIILELTIPIKCFVGFVLGCFSGVVGAGNPGKLRCGRVPGATVKIQPLHPQFCARPFPALPQIFGTERLTRFYALNAAMVPEK